MLITYLYSESTSELKDHMDGAAGLHVVAGNGQLIGELLTAENETDLLNINTFLFLQGLLHLKNCVLRIEVELLLSSREGLDH